MPQEYHNQLDHELNGTAFITDHFLSELSGLPLTDQALVCNFITSLLFSHQQNFFKTLQMNFPLNYYHVLL